MISFAPLIVNNVAHVTSMNDAPHVLWQAEYLMRLEGDTCCSADCK